MGGVFAFGPFVLDTAARRLLRDGEPFYLPGIQLALLCTFVERAGQIVSKEELIAAGWKQEFVEDNTLAKAVLRLRRAIDAGASVPSIATVARLGYRFTAEIKRIEPLPSLVDPRARLAPYRAFVDGRALIETLDLANLGTAARLFEDAVQQEPRIASHRVGLANVLLLKYESTRFDLAPDTASLLAAEHHAQEACRLDERYSEAFATFGFILSRRGQNTDGIAALRHAITLDVGNWRAYARLAWVSWGEERLSAVTHVRDIAPHPFMDLLAAILAIARGSLGRAEQLADAGLVAAAAEHGALRFGTIGLDLVKALLLLARGATDEAAEAFRREGAREKTGHLYAREYAAHAHYGLGALALRAGDKPASIESFTHAVRLAPRHAMAHAGLIIATGPHALGAAGTAGAIALASGVAAGDDANRFEIALARAAVLMAHGEDQAAVTIVADALAAAPPGQTGWMIPVEPLLNVQAAPDRWQRVLGILRSRAR